jgi:xylan 1,4-beta-xylosidase
MKTNKNEFQNVTETVSRRDALKLGGTLLAASVLPWQVQADESGPTESVSSLTGPKKLTPAQRDGITGKTADLGNGYYLNPILAGDYSDPAVLKDGKDYYMSHSMCGGLTPGILIWHSRDLVNWEPVCRALKKSGCTVPEIVKYKDRYFIYFIANGPQDCQLITAPTIAGPWSEPASIGYGDQIDPGYIMDRATGRHYLYFSQGWLVELSSDGLKMTGEPKKTYEGWQYPKDWANEGFCLESPKLFYRNGYYYLCVAEGGTGGAPTSHMLAAARSKSVLGPWENSPYNPVVHTYSIAEPWWSRGHGPVIEGPDGNWWVIYHAYENNFRTLGRQTLLQPLEWTDDGWFKVAAGNHPGQPIKKPTGGEIVSGGLALSDDFKGKELGLQWAAIGRANEGKSRLTSEGLEMTAVKGDSANDRGFYRGSFFQAKGLLPGDISLLAVIPINRSYEVQVRLKCQPGVEAGLLLYYCPEALAGIGRGTQNEIWTMGSIYRRSERLSQPTDEIYLKVVNRENVITLFWSNDGKQWTQSEFAHEVSGYHHNVFNGYAGLRVALYATGAGSVWFNDFRYRGLENEV